MMYSARRVFGPLAAFALLLPLCALLGMVVALGSTQLSLLAIGAVGGVLLLLVPTTVVLALLLVLSFVVVGLASYYLKLHQSAWVPYALCLFLWIKLPIDALQTRAARRVEIRDPPFIYAIYAFIAIAIVSTLVNETALISALVGAKNFIFVWSVALLVATGVVGEKYLRNVWLGLLGVAGLQAPFAILQHFTQFKAQGNFDAVVGTFGGNPDGGGASGSMAIFVCSSVGLAIALMRAREVPAWVGCSVLVACVVSLLMAEVKVFFLLLPLVLAIVMLREVRRRPLVVVAAGLLAVLVLGAMFSFYKTNYTTQRTEARRLSATDYLDYMFKVDSNPEFVNRFTGEVSRIGAPLIWLRRADDWGPEKPLIGYGMTATRVSQTIGIGQAQRRFGFTLSTSSLTVLLWETGWLGTLAMLLGIGLCALTAWRLSGNQHIPPFHRATLEACAAALAVAAMTLPYNTAFVDGPSLQVFYAFVFGYVLFWYRAVQDRDGFLAEAARR
jgi:hypothetical protein